MSLDPSTMTKFSCPHNFLTTSNMTKPINSFYLFNLWISMIGNYFIPHYFFLPHKPVFRPINNDNAYRPWLHDSLAHVNFNAVNLIYSEFKCLIFVFLGNKRQTDLYRMYKPAYLDLGLPWLIISIQLFLAPGNFLAPSTMTMPLEYNLAPINFLAQ